MTTEQVTNEYTKAVSFIIDTLKDSSDHDVDTLCFILRLLKARQRVIGCPSGTVTVASKGRRGVRNWSDEEKQAVKDIVGGDGGITVTTEMIELVQEATGRNRKGCASALYRECKRLNTIKEDDCDV